MRMTSASRSPCLAILTALFCSQAFALTASVENASRWFYQNLISGSIASREDCFSGGVEGAWKLYRQTPMPSPQEVDQFRLWRRYPELNMKLCPQLADAVQSGSEEKIRSILGEIAKLLNQTYLVAGEGYISEGRIDQLVSLHLSRIAQRRQEEERQMTVEQRVADTLRRSGIKVEIYHPDEDPAGKVSGGSKKPNIPLANGGRPTTFVALGKQPQNQQVWKQDKDDYEGSKDHSRKSRYRKYYLANGRDVGGLKENYTYINSQQKPFGPQGSEEEIISYEGDLHKLENRIVQEVKWSRCMPQPLKEAQKVIRAWNAAMKKHPDQSQLRKTIYQQVRVAGDYVNICNDVKKRKSLWYKGTDKQRHSLEDAIRSDMADLHKHRGDLTNYQDIAEGFVYNASIPQ